MPRTRASRKRQTRLTFSPAPADAVPPASPGSAVRSPAFVRYEQHAGSPLRPKASQGPQRTLEYFAGVAVQSQRLQQATQSAGDESDDSEEDVVASSPVKRRRRGMNLEDSFKKAKAKRPSQEEEEYDSSDSDIAARPSKKRRRAPTQGLPPESQKESQGTKAKDMESKEPSDASSSDSDVVVTSSQPKRRRLVKGRPSSQPTQESDEEPQAPSEPETPRRRAASNDQDDLDIEEDLEDLRDSALTETRTRGRVANSAKAKRQIHLEALRRRRAGRTSGQQLSSEIDGSQMSEMQEESSSMPPTSSPMKTIREQSEDESSNEDSESSEASSEASHKSEAPPSSPEDLDKYEEDFIADDDENGQLGAPDEGLNLLPFEFSRHRYKRLKDYFKDVVEWMVHNKLNPAFPRHDPVYQAAFQKVNDEVMGLTASQLISTVWTSEFQRALEARPTMDVLKVGIVEGQMCDACKRSGHPATYDAVFRGKPYALETLEAVEDEDSSDSSSSSSSDSEDGEEGTGKVNPGNRDRHGRPLPDEDTHFRLGRHCKTKAEMAHTLLHWRFHLNEWVVDFLANQDIYNDKQVVRREKWSTKRRTKYANKIVDMMVEVGEVNSLWRDFNNNVKIARGLKEARFPKGTVY